MRNLGLVAQALAELAVASGGPAARLLSLIGSGGGGAPGPPGPPGPVGASVANTAALAAQPTAGFLPGTIVLVQSMWDFWNYDPFDTTSVPDGITIVPAFGGGFWHRMEIPDQLWIDQTTWFIDPAAGNDENTGDTGIAALASHAEYNRRVGGPERTLLSTDANIFVTLVGLVPDVIAIVTSDGPAITYQGALPAPVATTVAAVTNADPTTQTPFTTTLAIPWAGQKLVHDTTNNTWFWGYDDVGTLAQCTPPNQNAAVPFFTLGAEPAPGDDVLLYDYAAFATLDTYQFISNIAIIGIYLSNLYLRGAGARAISGSVVVDRCSGPLLVEGVEPLIYTSADVFPGGTGIINATFEASGCFFANVIFTSVGPLSLLAYNNFLTVEFRACQIAVVDARLISSTTLPLAARIQINDKSLVSTGPIWSDTDAGATLTVAGNSYMTLLAGAGGTANFNVTNLAIGTIAPDASPNLIPGAVVPAHSLCDTPALLFAAPFLVAGISVANDYTEGSYVRVKGP